MGPGMPGIGIASLFYILLALVAPVVELVQVIRGRREQPRWRSIWIQFSISLATITSLAALYWMIDVLLDRGWLTIPASRLAWIPPNWAISFGALIVVMISVAATGALVNWRGGDECPDELASLHCAGVVPAVIDLRSQAPQKNSGQWPASEEFPTDGWGHFESLSTLAPGAFNELRTTLNHTGGYRIDFDSPACALNPEPREAIMQVSVYGDRGCTHRAVVGPDLRGHVILRAHAGDDIRVLLAAVGTRSDADSTSYRYRVAPIQLSANCDDQRQQTKPGHRVASGSTKS